MSINRMRHIGIGLSALMAAAVLIPAGSYAQSADDSEAQSTYGEFEEILVTARRREENLQDVPSSISAFSESALQAAGISNVVVLQDIVPGLTATNGVNESTARFFIRGIGTAVPGPGVETAVPIYIDDVYYPSGLASKFDVFALERVEVLRGPQGTLYGRNSFGGAIKVYTKGFSDELEGRVSLTVGTENRQDVTAELRTPIVEDKLWLGLGYAKSQRDGYQDLVVLDQEGWADDSELLRAKVQFKPNDRLDLVFSFDQTDRDNPSKQPKALGGTQTVNIVDGLGGPTAGALAPFVAAGFEANRLLTDTNPDVIEANTGGNERVDLTGYSLSATLDLNEQFSMKYIGGKRDLQNIRTFDIDTGPSALIQLAEDFRAESESHELQLIYSGRFDAILGVFDYQETADAFTLSTAGVFNGLGAPPGSANPAGIILDPEGRPTSLGAGNLSNVIDTSADSQSVFASVSFSLTESLDLTFGGRYTSEDKTAGSPQDGLTFTYPNGVPISGPDIVPNGEFVIPAGATVIADSEGLWPEGAGSYSGFTPDVSLAYKPSDSMLIYGSWQQGFRAGAVNLIPNTTFASLTDEEIVDAFEIGIKSTWMDDRVLLNASVYHNDFSDLVVAVVAPVPLSVSATGELGIPVNAGAASSTGVEIEFGVYVTDRFKLSGNVSHTDFKIDEVISLVNSVPTNIASDFPVQDLTPEFQGYLSAEYSVPVANVGTWRFYASAAHRDDISVGPGLRQSPIDFEFSDSFTNVTAGIELTGEDDAWRVALTGSNLLDERRPVNVINGGPLFGAITWFNEPMTWALTASHRF